MRIMILTLGVLALIYTSIWDVVTADSARAIRGRRAHEIWHRVTMTTSVVPHCASKCSFVYMTFAYCLLPGVIVLAHEV